MTREPVLRLLEQLPRAEPDAARSERVRAKCHAALDRRHARRAPRQPVTIRFWEPATVVGVCVLYLAELVRHALHLYSLR